jgi:hypothetical protein
LLGVMICASTEVTGRGPLGVFTSCAGALPHATSAALVKIDAKDAKDVKDERRVGLMKPAV